MACAHEAGKRAYLLVKDTRITRLCYSDAAIRAAVHTLYCDMTMKCLII